MKANNSISILFSFLFFTIKTFAQAPELILPTTHYAMSVVISADDKWLVSAGEGEVKIWNNETGQLIKNLKFGNGGGYRNNYGNSYGYGSGYRSYGNYGGYNHGHYGGFRR